jgi:hypothetical protein
MIGIVKAKVQVEENDNELIDEVENEIEIVSIDKKEYQQENIIETKARKPSNKDKKPLVENNIN